MSLGRKFKNDSLFLAFLQHVGKRLCLVGEFPCSVTNCSEIADETSKKKKKKKLDKVQQISFYNFALFFLKLFLKQVVKYFK